MPQSPIGPDGPRRAGFPPRTSTRRPGGRWLAGLAILAALASPASLWAQQEKEPAAGSSSAPPGGATPLARYFPKDHLIMYLEFSGLDAHADAWSKTAACKMLTETPLGEMLEEVSAQLMDKGLSFIPGHKLSGADIVAVTKHAVQHGFAMGLNRNPAVQQPQNGGFATAAIVIRGAAKKDSMALWARAMSSLVTGGRAQLDKRGGRTLVVVPLLRPGAAEVKEQGKVWWAEKEDLVISFVYPWGPDAIIAALDGKVPSAVDHPLVKEMFQRETGIEPVGIAFLDFENVPQGQDPGSQQLRVAYESAGVKRIGLRFGFDDDAMVRELQIVAPKPRKSFLTLFDQPGFDNKGLMPLPEGVDTFLEVSVDPNALIDSISQLVPGDALKAKVDEFADSIRGIGKIDFRKDFLGRIGPRIVLFLGSDNSAKVSAGSLGSEMLQGLTPQASIQSALSTMSKLTLVTEVSEPKAFARTLEGAVTALNHQLAKQTADILEKADEEKEQPAAGGLPGQGRPGGGRAGGGPGAAGGQRGTRKRSPSSLAPRFQMMPGTDTSSIAYILQTPSDSPLKMGEANFRPVIRLEGKYLVISAANDAAEGALKAIKQKGWKPSEDLRKVTEHLPAGMIVLGVSDPRIVMPGLLASLPGTLQTYINSGITLARAAGNNPPPGGMPPPGGGPGAMGPGAMNPGGPGMSTGRPGGRGGMGRGPGGPMMPGSQGVGGPGSGGPGGPGGPGAGGPGGNNDGGIPADAMIELKVDSDKLPKAEDLRSRYFLTTFAITVSDQDIRFVQREAFLSFSKTEMNLSAMLIMPAIQASRAAALRAQAANAAQGAQAPAPAAAPATGPPGGRPGPGGGAMPPGGRPGGRRRPGG